MLRTLSAAALLALVAGAAMASGATHEVRMLNRGEDGAMVFEPAFVQAEPGDTIVFVPTDRGHNAATLDGMWPEGAEPVDGALGEEVSITVTEEGLYGIKCTPHLPMGMVALIQVGEASNLDAVTAAAAGLRAKGKERFEGLLAQVQ